MPDFKLGFKGPYIAAVEFGGKQPTVTIESVKLEPLVDEKNNTRDRWILYFKGHRRGTEGWAGRSITLASQRVQFGKTTTEGIRIVGSPDLQQPMRVEVKLPRRKPVTVTIQPTKKGQIIPLPEEPAPDESGIGEDERREILAEERAQS
jgi:hypothetical protein